MPASLPAHRSGPGGPGARHTSLTMAPRRPADGRLVRWRTRDRIVVIEDDHHISDLVAMYLRRDGFRVLQADDAERGLAHDRRSMPGLVIVDIGLPGELDGLDVCRRLAAPTPAVPVILTARDDEVDRVLGLELGRRRLRDQAVQRPRAGGPGAGLLRRAGAGRRDAAPGRHRFGAVVVDTGRREVTRRRPVVPLATREFDLLAFLVAQPGAGSVPPAAPRRGVG